MGGVRAEKTKAAGPDVDSAASALWVGQTRAGPAESCSVTARSRVPRRRHAATGTLLPWYVIPMGAGKCGVPRRASTNVEPFMLSISHLLRVPVLLLQPDP